MRPWELLPFWPKGRKILLKGEVVNEADITADDRGTFQRAQSTFRQVDIPAADVTAGRWYLFACYGCPWAHRAILMRHLKGLEDAVPLIATKGWWPFTRGLPALATGGWCVSRPLPSGCLRKASTELQAFGALPPFYLWRLFVASDPLCTGRVTVPLLWDSETARVVNNESSDILRIFSSPAFSKLGSPDAPDLYPQELRGEIDMVNERLYDSFNNGVYRCGFAGTPGAYEKAAADVAEVLVWMEDRLKTRKYLCGDRLTESDVRCFPTLLRFDGAYRNAFRCNKRGSVRRNFPNLQRYLRDLYRLPAFRKSSEGMLFGYPLMYFCICRWEGRRLSNSARLLECAVFWLLGALAPDSFGLQYWLATLLTLPLRLGTRLLCLDPLPDAGGVL